MSPVPGNTRFVTSGPSPLPVAEATANRLARLARHSPARHSPGTRPSSDVDPAALSSLRLAVSAGDGLPAALQQAWTARFGVEIWTAWG